MSFSHVFVVIVFACSFITLTAQEDGRKLRHRQMLEADKQGVSGVHATIIASDRVQGFATSTIRRLSGDDDDDDDNSGSSSTEIYGSTSDSYHTDDNSYGIPCSIVQETQALNGFIVVELKGNLLSDQQLTTIGQIVKNAYNDLISCDIGQSRTIASVQFVDQVRIDDNEFRVKYRVTAGSCQGCLSQPTLLWVYTKSCGCTGPSNSSLRNFIANDIYGQFASYVRDVIEVVDSSIVPSTQTPQPTLPPTNQLTFKPTTIPTIDQSVPDISLFSQVQLTTDNIALCPDWVEFETSYVVVDFAGCPSELTDVHLEVLANYFIQLYNTRNDRLDLSLPCDPFFREIVLATPTLQNNVTFKVDHDRRLESDEYDSYHEETEYGSYTEDNEYSSSGCRGKFEIRFDVLARCMGCDVNRITLFDVDEAANFNANFYSHDDRRLDYREVEHNSRQLLACQCPLNAELRAVSEDEMGEKYDDIVRSLSGLPVPLRVKEIIEVEKVQCQPTTNDFGTTVRLAFATDAVDSVPTPAVLGALASNFLGSYNDLSQRFCDPFFRYPVVVDVLNQTVVPVPKSQRRNLQGTTMDFSFISDIAGYTTPKRNVTLQFDFNLTNIFTFIFYIKGNCRGCAIKTPLFQNEAARRRLSTIPSRNAKYRRVQSGAQCFCASSNYQDGAPTQREFSEKYDQDILSDPRLLANYGLAFFEEDTAANAMVASRSECDFNSDCPVVPTGSLCLLNTCLSEGSPRITLTWTGDDDLDLAVYTPDGTKVWYGANFDTTTRGTFDTRYVQEVWGNHVESVYFPSGPPGMYRIEVTSYEQRGNADTWTVEVFVEGTLVHQGVDSGGMMSANEQIHYYLT